MARSQKVDSETALHAAGLAFMECGYSGMSTRDLEKRSGITKFTLQTKYGGKKALFLMTLDLYLDELLPWIDNSVSQGGIPDFFRMRADDTRMPEQGRFGCLMVNALTEFGATDPEISTRSSRYFEALRSAFKSALMKASNEGTLDMNVEIELEAERLLVSMIGLNISIRTYGSNSAAADMAEGIALSVQRLQRPQR
jgi:TetR/AcrR family transcriptional repressor of nem operon